MSAEHEQESPKDVVFTGDVDYDRRNARSANLALIGGVSIVLLAVFAIGIYWLFTVTWEQIEHDQVGAAPSKELVSIREREEEQLHQYGYINKEQGVVRLSVERAMQLVEEDAKAGKVSWNTRKSVVKPELPGGARGMSWTAEGQGKALPPPAVEE